jgi:PKD repeat protein
LPSAAALVAEGAAFTLDGTASTSPDLPATSSPRGGNRIVRYLWSMGDGEEIVQRPRDRDFGRPSYRYATHGVYTVTLTVTDSADNPCNSATVSRTITVNAPPVANAGGGRSLVAGEIAAFDAGASSDPDGTIVSYLWDFGDGSQAAGPAVRHAFHRTGDYQVRLTVLDDSPFETGKGFDTVTVNVREAANRQPIAHAGADRTVFAGEAVRFDAGRSVDPDGEILSYAWDFGDGFGSDAPMVEHTFWQPGTYSVSLAVTDNGKVGNTRSVDSAAITVLPAQNRPPVAVFPQEFSATTFRPLALDASAADDRDGSIVTFEWDFGDGSKGSGPKVSHQYEKPGVYDARLVLRDNGLPEPAAVGFNFKVHVADKVNLPPVAAAGKDITANAGEEIALDASASRDSDGSILSYRWELGDGNRTSGIRSRHIYQYPGTYRVKLTVTDDGPGEALSVGDELVVTVLPVSNTAPVAAVSGPAAVNKGEAARFDGTASNDPDGNILQYRWAFGDGGASSDASPQHTFHDAGKYEVRLTVTDDGATPMSAERTVTVTVTGAGTGEGVQ